MVANGSKAGPSSSAPPHELNVWNFVESRASELKSLHSVIADRLDNNFRSQRNKRRRTTGHDNRVAGKKFKRRRVGVVNTDSEPKDEKKVSRRVRRNVELKRNPPNGFVTSGDGTKRLRTHVWHAKRFTMKKLWGFYIPLGLHGRGRGSRALLKKLKHGVLMHDASYYGCVQLEGPEDRLMSVLSSVLVPSPSACSEETSRDILVGAISGTAMLHHAGKTFLPPIAPVTYLWRPKQRVTTNVEGLSLDVSAGEQSNDDGPIVRQLWVWVHAAALEEAYDSLDSACQRQTDTISSVHCVSREGQLAKLEFMGSEVFQLLQKTLAPATSRNHSNSENSWLLKKCFGNEHADPGESEKSSLIEKLNQISSSAIVTLVVKDPRLLTENEKRNRTVSDGKPVGFLSNDDQMQVQTVSLPKHEAECALGCGDLWDASKAVCPPVEESILCMEKHHRNKEFVRIGNKSSGSQTASINSINGECSRVCPVLLLRNEKNEESVARCSIMLPLSWVKAFWITFMSNGAHAIGLRENHWVACEIGLPYFPLDFPDCNAYSDFMAMETVEINNKASLLPPPKMPLEVPIPPPWDCVHLTSEKRSTTAGKSHTQAEEVGAQDEKLDMDKNSDCGRSQTKISGCNTTSFEGIIARTSCTLNKFLHNISGNHLLLFPRIPDQRNCLYKFMRDKEFLKPDTVMSEVKCGETLCYVRVLLRAFKEGVFEQGAVVCATDPADIMSWTSSSECDDQRLQIPQSSVHSYFRQLSSGKWELHIPEDEALHGSFRWPIGFVTTGFVRGSKKAMAGAICEASLLSRLREEQWKALPVQRRKKEIYVLVRNTRSTAYRLALATIVLEQQEEDVKFI